MPTELISARTVRALDAAACAIGIRLDLTVLVPSLDRPDANEIIPVSEGIAYCRALLSDDRETLGLELAENLPLEVTGLWGFLLRTSATYGVMLRRAERYIRIVNTYPEFRLSERDGMVAMVCEHPLVSPYGNRPQAVMAMMGHWVTWGRELTGVNFPLAKAQLRWSGPRERLPFETFAHVPIEFGAKEDAFYFASDTMELRLRESTVELAAELETMAAALIKKLSPRSQLLEEVEVAICEEILMGNARIEDVARRLAVTPRTLHRRLCAEQTTFRKLKENLLQTRAEELISDHGLSLKEATYLLGYSEPANFSRAFRRWTGSAPSVWRHVNL